MKKHRKIFCMIAGCLFLLSSCTTKQETTDIKSIAVEGFAQTDLPKGKNIVKDKNLFVPVKEDQSYQPELDDNVAFDTYGGMAAMGTKVYSRMHSSWLYYLENDESGLVCFQPDCEHNNTGCPAFMPESIGLTYYRGNLYTVSIDMELEKFLLMV